MALAARPAEQESERARCYTIAKCVYLEGNSGGSKMKEGGTGPGRFQHLVLLMIGFYLEYYVLAPLFFSNWEHFERIASKF